MRRLRSYALSALAVLALAGCGGTPAAQPTAKPVATVQPAASAQTVATVVAAPVTTVGKLTLTDPWIRPVSLMAAEATPMPTMEHMTGTAETTTGMTTGPVTGGYVKIANSGAEPDYLVAASAASELVEKVELHTVVDENGVMKMRPVEKIEVPANGEVMLKPGSFHVMFIGMKKELKEGDLVKLKLTFEKAGPVELEAVVRAPMP